MRQAVSQMRFTWQYARCSPSLVVGSQCSARHLAHVGSTMMPTRTARAGTITKSQRQSARGYLQSFSQKRNGPWVNGGTLKNMAVSFLMRKQQHLEVRT